MLALNLPFAWLVKRLPRARFVPLTYRFFILNILIFSALIALTDGETAAWVGHQPGEGQVQRQHANEGRQEQPGQVFQAARHAHLVADRAQHVVAREQREDVGPGPFAWLVKRLPRARFVPLTYRFFILNILIFSALIALTDLRMKKR
jgi:hypothetical protein